MVAENEEVKLDKTLDLIVYATDSAIKVLDRIAGEQFGTKIYCELKPETEGQKFTDVRLSGNKLIVSLQGGAIK